MAHGAHQKFPIDSVEETFDVEIKYPVPLPTSLPSHGQCVVGRFAWAIPVGVLVELGSRIGSKYRLTTVWAIRSATAGIPSGRVFPESPFGMSTRHTGGGI
jgi:hypothetical protein